MPLTVRTIVTGPWRENCYLLGIPGGDAVIIDPGDSPIAIARALEEEGFLPRAVLATHGHHDHVGAVGALQGRYSVPFYLHSADAPQLHQLNAYRFAFDRSTPVADATVHGTLEDRSDWEFGKVALRVQPTPGHTPGSVTLHTEVGSFVGDTVLPGRIGRTDLPGGNAELLQATLLTLAELPRSTALFPGHGSPTDLGVELDTNAALRSALT